VPGGTVAIVGGGGIGVDVATFLVEDHDEAARAVGFARRFGVDVTDVLVGSRAQRWPTPEPYGRPTPPRPGDQVTLLRRSGKFGAGVGITSRWVVLAALREAGVRMLTGLSYTRISPGVLEVADAAGASRAIAADTVVVCAGQESDTSLVVGLEAAGVAFEVVGGARDARAVDAVRATTEGLAAARRLAIEA
jgi:2,4-dienoyl-CoA reductase (NADPH2)